MNRSRFFIRLVFIWGISIALCSYKIVAGEENNGKIVGDTSLPLVGVSDIYRPVPSPFAGLNPPGIFNIDYTSEDSSTIALNLDLSVSNVPLTPGLKFVEDYLQDVDIFMDRYNKIFLPRVYYTPAYNAELEQVGEEYMKLFLYKHSYPARFFSETVPPNLNEEEKSIILAWQDVEHIAKKAWLDNKRLNGIIGTIAAKYPKENLLQKDKLGSETNGNGGSWNINIELSKSSLYLLNVQIDDKDNNGVCESLRLSLYKYPPDSDVETLGSETVKYYSPAGNQYIYKTEESYLDYDSKGQLTPLSIFKVENEVKKIGLNYEYKEEYFEDTTGEKLGSFVISHLKKEGDRISAEVSYNKAENEQVVLDSGLDLGSLSFGSLLETVVQTPSYTIGR